MDKENGSNYVENLTINVNKLIYTNKNKIKEKEFELIKKKKSYKIRKEFRMVVRD